MPDVSLQQETAEAVSSALYKLEWEHLGDTDHGNGSYSTWFRRGVQPHDTRIEVLISALAPVVLVNVEFRNLHHRPVQKGKIVIQINVGGSNRARAQEDSKRAVLRCLEIFRDVLEEKGVAGPSIKVNPLSVNDIPESSTGD